jgi:hypothetical protein
MSENAGHSRRLARRLETELTGLTRLSVGFTPENPVNFVNSV